MVNIVDYFEDIKGESIKLTDFVYYAPKLSFPKPLKVQWTKLTEVTLDRSFSTSVETSLMEAIPGHLIMEKWGNVRFSSATKNKKLKYNNVW